MKKKQLVILTAVLGVGIIVVGSSYIASYNKRLNKYCTHRDSGTPHLTFHYDGPNREACEGKEFVNLDVGTYQVGNLTFHIPRDYLWQQKFKDGPVEGIYLSLFYPSLEAVNDISRLYDNELTVAVKKCRLKACETNVTPNYLSAIVYPRFKPTYTKPKFIKELGLWKYDIVDHTNPPERSEVYYQGSKESPPYWFVCALSHPRQFCAGDYWFSKGISVNTRFLYRYLNEHAAIHEAVDKKLKSFLENDHDLIRHNTE